VGGREGEREGGDSWATRETNLKRRPRTLMAGALTIAVRLLETRPKPKQGRDQWRGRERERGAEVCVGVGVARCLAASLVSSVATRAPLKEAVAEELRPQTPRTRAPKTNTRPRPLRGSRGALSQPEQREKHTREREGEDGQRFSARALLFLRLVLQRVCARVQAKSGGELRSLAASPPPTQGHTKTPRDHLNGWCVSLRVCDPPVSSDHQPNSSPLCNVVEWLRWR